MTTNEDVIPEPTDKEMLAALIYLLNKHHIDAKTILMARITEINDIISVIESKENRHWMWDARAWKGQEKVVRELITLLGKYKTG